MKEKVERLLNKPDLSMIEVQHLYQEISCIEVLKNFINSCKNDDEKLIALNDIQDMLDDVRNDIYDQQEQKTEAICR